ncbi:C40 family peptidase [Cytophagaceae bacterium YF14B1]|uniref:C40 family peptidase n=1 Tax=Xanthocytophaga flava TaxID=3048013 RepID=A0AAE3QHX5_9BACT|nr:C40 family peptidase [Xanthocytophaga flavus]MDJ1479160.1 C40 family peptidase [Xanthocytophaga flavus]
MKTLLSLFLSPILFFTLMSGIAQNSDKYHYNQVYDYTSSDIIPYNYNADELTKLAKSFVGVPYVAEGKEPSGFDCSGFTFYVYKQFGIYLPYFSSEQGTIGNQVYMDEAQPGDLIFFTGSDPYTSTVGHVGIIVSQKGEKLTWVHATTSKGVRTDTMANTYYKARFLTIRRVAN